MRKLPRFCCFLFLLFSFTTNSVAHTAQPNAAIASAHPLATAVGKGILAQGGNAFDAAVAVAAALAVVEPYSSGLGGGGFFLLHRARDNKQIMIDARERAPSRATPDMYRNASDQSNPRASLDGPLAAGIPGTPAGLVHLAKHYGRLPLRQSLAPAIHLAQQGFPADARYRALAQSYLNLLRQHPATAAQFLHQQAVPEADALVVQENLAKTLQLLARRGAAGFYRGPIAQEMVKTVNAAGGIWRKADLARYRIVERKPVVFHYREMRIVSAAPPSAGGLTLGEALHILERYDLDQLRPAMRMHLVAEALRRAYHDRARYMGDPDFLRIPQKRLLSEEYAATRAATIDLNNATPSAQFEPVAEVRQGTQTTHFSIVDQQGNRVAATLSINTIFGSGFVAGKTGVLLNNEMDDFAIAEKGMNTYNLVHSGPNRIAPGKRPLSSMSPTFVEDARGTLILGAPGGSRIPSMVLLAILNYRAQTAVDIHKLVSAPRYHHQYLPDRLEVEPESFSNAVLDDLQLIGHVIRVNERKWGNMQAVWINRVNGKAEAASDPRGMGSGQAWH